MKTRIKRESKNLKFKYEFSIEVQTILKITQICDLNFLEKTLFSPTKDSFSSCIFKTTYDFQYGYFREQFRERVFYVGEKKSDGACNYGIRLQNA